MNPSLIQPGALCMVDIPGPVLDQDTAEHLKKYGVQAVCLFGKNIESLAQLSALCAELREVMGAHALIALDHEGGAIIRPAFWPFVPSAMSLGAADDTALTGEMNALLARQLRSVGINWNFAPVLDINSSPANPVIAERAFGAEADHVIRHGRAALGGHASEQIAACVKHFPGHGDTHQDSHHDLPHVSKSRAELEAGELRPFRELLPHTPAIMTAHIVFDQLDAQHPATLSRPILTELLRGEWGYDGVIVTDSMGMKAIDDHYGRGEAGVLALQAGADLVMALGRREAQVATLEAIAGALRDGTLLPLDAERKVRRLQALAEAYPAAQPANDGADTHNQADTRNQADTVEAWARGMTAYRQPTAPEPGQAVLLLAHRTPQRETVSEAAADAETLARELGEVYDVQLMPFEQAEQIDWAAAQASGKPVILASTFRHRQPGWRGAQPDLHLALYNPYAVLDINAPAVLTYGFRPEARRALIGWLRGERQLPGQSPTGF
ncbi:glycoside hydrolase family 3 protein [Deinococcus sp.]|uniref:glycoside hydrolase family 3 protein n=1 Tax=Deinococcus sp. TaxID=47478 RepID=UPI0025C45BE0|nr:glycoside hydrolase family 3 protein [Deinococcus sp.]